MTSPARCPRHSSKRCGKLPLLLDMEREFDVLLRVDLTPLSFPSHRRESMTIRPSQHPLVQTVIVDPGSDAADNWIAEHISTGDIAITNDIPLAARCIEAGARVLRPNGEALDEGTIGAVLATRNLMTDLRSAGAVTGGPRPFDKRDRSRFLDFLDRTVQAAKRG